eukprot:PhF_6_TR37527/c1_g1_i2/m.55514
MVSFSTIRASVAVHGGTKTMQSVSTFSFSFWRCVTRWYRRRKRTLLKLCTKHRRQMKGVWSKARDTLGWSLSRSGIQPSSSTTVVAARLGKSSIFLSSTRHGNVCL